MERKELALKDWLSRRLALGQNEALFLLVWERVDGDVRSERSRQSSKERDEIRRQLLDQAEELISFHWAALDTGITDVPEQIRARPNMGREDENTLDSVFYSELSEAETERARGISVYYAALAREEDYVIEFREKMFGGETLQPSAAKEWSTSVAAQCLDPGTYAALRHLQSPPGHPKVEITGVEGGIDLLERTYKLRDCGTGITMTSRLSLPDGLAIHNITLGEEQIEVYEGMTLRYLQRCGERLAKQYGWSQERAMWFIITDIAPPVHPLDASMRFTLLGGPGRPWTAKRQVATITVDPWVSETTVLNTYRRLRHDLRGKQGRIALKTLTLFRFIIERDGLKPQVKAKRRCDAVPWTARMKEWNEIHKEAHPSWQYRDRANFRTAYYEVAIMVVGPEEAPKALMDRLNAIAKEQRRMRADSHPDSQDE